MRKYLVVIEKAENNYSAFSSDVTDGIFKDGEVAEVFLPVESLHNIYLFCKEAINNAVKYSQGSVLELSLRQFDHTIQFSIIDNGKEFDMATVKKGNGLRNTHKRADEAAAILSVKSTPHEGTVISLQCKII